MKFALGFILGLSLTFSSGFIFAQSNNDGLKDELNQDGTPAPKAKKVVQKRIKKVAIHKKIVKKKIAEKKIAVAQAAQAKEAVEPVVVRDSGETVSESIRPNMVVPAQNIAVEPPTLGESAGYKAAAPAYQPIFILQPTQPQTIAAAQPAQVAAGAQAAQATPATTQAGQATSAQVQPTTTVDSTSVPEPRSEQLRKQREELEHQTENKLIERLEDDRLVSEKDRAQRIFAQPTPAPAAGAAPVAVVEPATPVQAPAPVVAAPVPAVQAQVVQVTPSAPTAPAVTAAPTVSVTATEKETDKIIVESDSKEKIQDKSLAPEGENSVRIDDSAKKNEDIEHPFSVGGMIGMANYPSVSNVTPYYSAGVLGTYKLVDHFAIQGSFNYSTFDVTNATFCAFCGGGALVKSLSQYNSGIGVTYSPLPGKITPVVGAILDYTRRVYSDRITYGFTTGGTTGSNAFDAGLLAGLDLRLAAHFILGAQFQYLWNLSYRTDDPLAYGIFGPVFGTPLEALSYYIATLNLRFEL